MHTFFVENKIAGTLEVKWSAGKLLSVSCVAKPENNEPAPNDFPDELLKFLTDHTAFDTTPVPFETLNLEKITPFRQKIYEILFLIKKGETLSYGELAAKADSPKACRAVGGAMAANPFLLVVPCHRVLAGNKKLGGFSGGLHNKRKLLDAENSEYTG